MRILPEVKKHFDRIKTIFVDRKTTGDLPPVFPDTSLMVKDGSLLFSSRVRLFDTSRQSYVLRTVSMGIQTDNDSRDPMIIYLEAHSTFVKLCYYTICEPYKQQSGDILDENDQEEYQRLDFPL